MFKDVLIVCHANICRSPMAEAMFKADAKVRTAGVVVHSAGLEASPGRGADPTVRSILLEKGVDVGEHRSRRLSINLTRSAQLILVMELAQIKAVEQLDRSSKGKVHLLGKWENIEILDPYRQEETIYRASEELVERSVANWIRKIC
jgi:protein-tyrosine phosphatase